MSTLDDRYRRFLEEEVEEERQIAFHPEKLSELLYLSKISKIRNLSEEEKTRYSWLRANCFCVRYE